MSPGALSSWAQHGREAPAFSIGNVIDFSFDDESRLSSVSRPAQPATTAFAYDGRSFLESADETQDGDGFSNPVYDSQGTLMSLEHNAGGGAASDRYECFYMAGRPVAQLEIDGATAAETWTYLTTDHLGTPALPPKVQGPPLPLGSAAPHRRPPRYSLPAPGTGPVAQNPPDSSNRLSPASGPEPRPERLDSEDQCENAKLLR